MTIAVQLQEAVVAGFVDSTAIVLFDGERGLFRCECLCRHSFLAPYFKDQIFQCPDAKQVVEFIELNNTDWQISNYELWIGRIVDKEKF